MVRIRKIFKIKNKHVILESAFLWMSATADSADSGCNSINLANSDFNSVDSNPTRPTKYKIGHPSRVAGRVSSAGGQLGQLGQLGLELGWFLKHWFCINDVAAFVILFFILNYRHLSFGTSLILLCL